MVNEPSWMMGRRPEKEQILDNLAMQWAPEVLKDRYSGTDYGKMLGLLRMTIKEGLEAGHKPDDILADLRAKFPHE
jgi:hypothetical protein